jgi:hypothetical protein
MCVRPALALVLLGLGLVTTAPVAAQGVETTGATEDDQYRRLLEEAIAEYEAGRYAEARALFGRAHERSPNARTLRGIGMAAFEMREYAESLRALSAALTDRRRPLTDEQRGHVQSLIDRSNAYVGRYRVTLAPADAQLRVDDEAAPLGDDGTLLLSLGEHAVEARCPGCATQRRTLQVRGGEDEELRFDLASVDLGAPGEPLRAAPDRLPSDGDGAEGGSTAAILMLAGAGVLAASAIAGVLWWLDRDGELDRCRNAGAACGNEETLESERGVAMGATVAFTAGALVLATIGLLSLGGGDDEARVACAPSIGGMSCVTQF